MRHGKLFAALLLVTAMVLTGCGGKPPEKIKVGVLLPGDDSGPRWDEADAKILDNIFKGTDYAYEPDIEDVADDPAKAIATATEMINSGVRVLVYAAASRETDAAITSTAKARGVPTVGYDWNDTGSAADYVVAVDHTKVGELQARGVIRGVRSTPNAKIVSLHTETTGPRTTARVEGQRNILQPRYDVGHYRLVATERVAAAQAVAPVLNRLLDANAGKIDAVLAADDVIARASIEALRQRGLAGKTVVTGYGATNDALRAVLRGEQFMTVYNQPAAQATAVGKLARAVAVGDQAAIDQMATPAVPGQPRTVLVAPYSVTLDTITQVFNSGAVESDGVCEGDLALRCNQLSIP